MTGEVIEIKCAQPYMVNAYLKSHDIVESVQVFSDKLRVLLKSGGDVPEIVSFLESKGVNITDVRKVQPSLEDIFVLRLGK